MAGELADSPGANPKPNVTLRASEDSMHLASSLGRVLDTIQTLTSVAQAECTTRREQIRLGQVPQPEHI
jgi:hypothetical protein